MKNFCFCLVFSIATLHGVASQPDSTVAKHASVLVIPYMPAMHLSDADPDISEGSEMEMPEMRKSFRDGIVKALNKNFAEVYDVRGTNNDFVMGSDRDFDVIYHSLIFESDSTYPSKFAKKFAVKDTSVAKKKDAPKVKPDKSYINVQIADAMLIPDLSEKFNADYFIFLNEIDIKTHFEDCINLALKIYRRDLKIHYSIYDRHGKQIYGDVAIAYFDSNSNDVNEIVNKNFPAISEYILDSFKKATN